MAIAFGGGSLIAFASSGDVSFGGNPLLGSLLAVAAAIAGSIYFAFGRSMRTRVAAMPYVWVVTGFAALITLAGVFLNHIPVVGYSTQAYLCILGLTIFPQLIGHSVFNFVVAYIAPTYISLSFQLLVPMSAVIAFLLFHEVPLPLQIVGSLVIMGGVALATLSKRPKRAEETVVVAPAAGD
jgi:drug/metabolite transporter (DMT)-like permease